VKYLKLYEEFFFGFHKSPLNINIDEIELLKYNLNLYEIPFYNIETIGYGNNGIAFDIGMDRIAKITTDIIEYNHAKSLENTNNEYLIKIYKTGKIYWDSVSTSTKQKLYLIVMEKLKMPNTNIKMLIEDCFDEFYPGRDEIWMNGFYNDKLVEPWIDQHYKSDYIQSLARQVFKNVANIIKEAQKNNIDTSDLGAKNVGLRYDKLVFFDMGGI